MNNKYNIIYNLLNVKGIGIVQANKILMSVQKFYDNEDFQLLKDSIADKLTLPQKEIFLASATDKLNIDLNKFPNLNYLSILDEKYPTAIKRTLSQNSPTLLSTLGNLDLLNKKTIGFCGSRKASDKGLSVATDCVEQFVEKNIVIASGYAAGIDQQTHLTSLKHGGSTIIILPEGINHFRIKKELKEYWDWDRILVISEFQPDAIWSANRAMQRNSTIISLSDVMILIESSLKGGSIEAGKKTLSLNKVLFAPIYDGMPESAKGNQDLLKKGAYPLKKSATTMRANLSRIFRILYSENEYRLL